MTYATQGTREINEKEKKTPEMISKKGKGKPQQ
jgi:hypothetical protein